MDEATFKAFEATFNKLNIPMTAEQYDIATIDLTPTVLKVKAGAPDMLFVQAFGAPAGHVLNSLDKIGWSVPIVGDQGMGGTNLSSMAPPSSLAKVVVEVARAKVYVAPEKRSARLANFIRLLKQKARSTKRSTITCLGGMPSN